jgi:hypothetical protein
MYHVYNSQILNAINKSRPDTVANFYVIQNFMDDIKKRDTPNLMKLYDCLFIFLSEYGKGCIEYLNNQFNQDLYMKQHNEHLMTCLCRSIHCICFTEEENEFLEKMMKHFDYT